MCKSHAFGDAAHVLGNAGTTGAALLELITMQTLEPPALSFDIGTRARRGSIIMSARCMCLRAAASHHAQCN